MAANNVDFSTPQWMRDLKLRKKCRTQEKQLSSGGLQPTGSAEHNLNEAASGSLPVVGRVHADETVVGKCNVRPAPKMVQERTWTEIQQYAGFENGKKKDSDSEDSAEDLQYGPGIVNKLKNRYLSLTLREINNKTRPSILHMRKATSLEHLLDEDDDHVEDVSKNHEGKYKGRTNGHTSNNPITHRRYNRNSSKAPEMKRARSVEAITLNTPNEVKTENAKPKRESCHEDMLILKSEGNDLAWKSDKVLENTVPTHRVNKPLMIPRIMNEREKPPADVVKHAVKIFEPPKSRSKPPQQTGEVAAKVGLFTSKTQGVKKPPLKQKPTTLAINESKANKPADTSNWKSKPKSPDITSLPSPIPDVSQISKPDKPETPEKATTSLSETPDLILHSSPLRKPPLKSTEEFIIAEKEHSIPVEAKTKPTSPNNAPSSNGFDTLDEAVPKEKSIPLHIPLKLDLSAPLKPAQDSRAPQGANLGPPETKPPLLLQKMVGSDVASNNSSEVSVKSPVVENNSIANCEKPQLSEQETKKNLINIQKSEKSALVKTKNGDSSAIPKSTPIVAKSNSINDVLVKNEVPKPKPRSSREQDTSMLFNFTKRSGAVPDYIQNTGHVAVGKIERPKVGEGGITFLPGVTLDDSFIEDDWQKSLEGPPSPCDVTFINDNILIDGKSSLSQKTTKRVISKNKLKFVEAVPQIFEYPSEASLLDDIPSPPPAPIASTMGHALPSLTGSSLASYTPKTGFSYDDFQLGVTKSTPVVSTPTKQETEGTDLLLTEVEEPVAFSAGTNSDILF